MTTKLETVEVLTRTLLDNITKWDQGKVTELLTLLEDHFTPFKFTKIPSQLLKQVGDFLKVPFKVVIRKDSDQLVEQTTYHTLLRQISKEHHHKLGDYTCNFHHESLFTHLIMCMLIAFVTAADTDAPTDSHFQFVAGITALLHDIGKPGTISTYESKDAKFVGFPYHAEHGASILHAGFDEKLFAPFFDKQTWDNITRVVGIHMCGYHFTHEGDPTVKVKWNHLRLENVEVKRILSVLSTADVKSCISDSEKKCVDKKEFLTHINEDFDAKSFQTFLTPGRTSMLIQLRGRSCSGKSTMSKRLVEFLIKTNIPRTRIHIVERDLVMCQYVAGLLGDRIPVERPDGELYAKYFAHYQKLKGEYVNHKEKGVKKGGGKEGREKEKENEREKENKTGKIKKQNHAHNINSIMSQQIMTGLTRGDVVIVDTVALMYPAAADILPGGCLKNTIRIAIDMNRLEELTEGDAKKNNLTLKQQIILSDSTSTLMKIPPSVKAKNNKPGWLPNMASLMSSTNLARDAADSNCRFRPHSSYQVSWSPSTEFGSHHLWAQLPKLLTLIDQNPINKDTLDTRELMEVLYAELEGNPEAISDWFRNNKFMCTPMFKDTSKENTSEYGRWYRINYIDVFCKDWNTRWSRECRGIVIHIDKLGKAHCVSKKVQRGAEMLTKLHVSRDVVESQEMSVASSIETDVKDPQDKDKDKKGLKTDHSFDKVQMITLEALFDGTPINAYLTSKVDGSLLAVNLYRKGTYLETQLRKLLEGADTFSQQIAKISDTINTSYLPIFSTQNTFFMCEIMQSYTATALAVGCNIFNDDQLAEEAKTHTPTQMLPKIIPHFLQKLTAMFKALPKNLQTDTLTVSFETVCRDRTTAWNERHTELAISYTQSTFNILGVTHIPPNTTGMFTPHFMIPHSVRAAKFEEPMWWKVDSGAKVVEMVDALDKILTDGIDEGEFLKTFPTNNNINTNTNTTPKPIDYEGFVLFTDTTNITGATERYDYSKIKTPTYYIAHKYHDRNVKKLLSLPAATTKIIPLAKEVKDFFLELPHRLTTVLSNITKELTAFVTDPKCKEHTLYKQLSPGPRGGFDKREDTATRLKIISANIEGVFSAHFRKEFTNLPESKEVDGILKSLVLKLSPWEEGCAQRVDDLIKMKDSTLCKFFDQVKVQPTVHSE